MKLNNYAKYPIILGIVCVVCGAALASVNYITAPVISAENERIANQALYDILDADGLEISGSPTDIAWTAAAAPDYLNDRKTLKCTDSNTYYYYNATSPVGYSGSITFGALVNASYDIIGYKFISSTEDSVGTGAAKEITISVAYPYAGTGSFVAGETIATGASAQRTLPAILTALDAVIADAKTIQEG